MAHTPGPWLQFNGRGKLDVEGSLIGPAGESPIASVTGYYTNAFYANARLIAAAPDLLEAAKFASEFMEERTNRELGGDASGAEAKALSNLYEAIAKAEGSDV